MKSIHTPVLDRIHHPRDLRRLDERELEMLTRRYAA